MSGETYNQFENHAWLDDFKKAHAKAQAIQEEIDKQVLLVSDDGRYKYLTCALCHWGFTLPEERYQQEKPVFYCDDCKQVIMEEQLEQDPIPVESHRECDDPFCLCHEESRQWEEENRQQIEAEKPPAWTYWITLSRVTLAGPYEVAVFYHMHGKNGYLPGELYRTSRRFFATLSDAQKNQEEMRDLYSRDGQIVKVTGA